MRARDLFYGLWIPDLFMQRVERDEDWTLMCPAECPGLDAVWGEEFELLYMSYEQQNHRCRKVIKARELWSVTAIPIHSLSHIIYRHTHIHTYIHVVSLMLYFHSFVIILL